MKDNDYLLYRILSGRLEYKNTFILDPKLRIKTIGRRVYNDILRNYASDPLNDSDIYILLVETGQWSAENERKFKSLPTEIEDLKVQYFQNFNNPAIRNSKKLGLEYSLGLYNKFYNIRHSYDYLTKKSIAYGAMWFEMIKCMYKGSDILSALNYYKSNFISDEDIRSIVLSSEWSSYCVNKNPLGVSPIKMTDEQRRLISWTNIYRNTYSHPDSPSEDIINDHLAFDGWNILQNRKQKAEKRSKINIGKIKDDKTSAFIVVNNPQEAREVMSLNDPNAMMKIESMYKQIDKDKHVREKDFIYRKFMK